MNIILWILQILLALHTTIGAVWKFSNSEKTIPSLAAIPHTAWLALSIVEILCSLALVLPFLYKPFAYLIPVASLIIATEMLLFCGVQFSSGITNNGQLMYWLVVAVFCAFIAYGRLKLSPL
jgi:hypothetical protein